MFSWKLKTVKGAGVILYVGLSYICINIVISVLILTVCERGLCRIKWCLVYIVRHIYILVWCRIPLAAGLFNREVYLEGIKRRAAAVDKRKGTSTICSIQWGWITFITTVQSVSYKETWRMDLGCGKSP